MALLNGAIQSLFGNVFGGLYLSGSLVQRTLVGDGLGGGSVSQGSPQAIKYQRDACTELMRGQAGYTDKDVRLIILQSGVAAVAVPSWFDWNPDFTINRVGDGSFTVSISADDLRPSAGTALYVSPNGNNANSGASALLAKRSIANAYNAGATTVIAEPGDYTRQNGFEGITLAARDLILINADPDAGDVVVARFEPPTALTWIQDGTYLNVWHCTRSTAVAVRDRSVVDANGNIERLTPQASVQLCSENPGSQFISGSTVNVCLSDERQPDDDVLIFLSGTNVAISAIMAGRTFWVGEGIEFWGGDTPVGTVGLAVADGSRIVCDGAKFKYATSASSGNGISVSNLAECYLFNCNAEANNLDGFNYHYSGGGEGHALEVNCIARDNGLTGGSNQGSSTHEDGRIIRVNGLYIDNESEAVLDINTSQSWNLGCRGSGSSHNFEVANSAIMTLDSCISDNASIGDLEVSTGQIFVYNLTSDGVFSGTPTEYTPGGAINTDSEVTLEDGSRYSVAWVTEDPAQSYWECRATPVNS